MATFIKKVKRRPFSERLKGIGILLNERGSVSVADLVMDWGISPQHARLLLRWASEKFGYATWDEDSDTLFIPERLKAQEEKKPQGEAKA